MFTKKFRPVQEETENMFFAVLFIVIWYGTLIRTGLSSGFHASLFAFMIFGLVPLFTMIQGVRRAWFYRRQRKEAINRGAPVQGRIVNVTRQTVYSNQNNSGRGRFCYCLTVEIVDSMTGGTSQFQSEPYCHPIHRFLASPYVQVYTDASGWKRYLEGFQLKQHKNDPDIFNGAKEFEELHTGFPIMKVVFVAIFLWAMLGPFLRR